MVKENDKTVSYTYFNRSGSSGAAGIHSSDALVQLLVGRLYSFLWEGHNYSITKGIKDGFLWDYEVKKAFEWVQNGKIKEEQIRPKLRLRMAYALAHEGMDTKGNGKRG